MDFEKNQIAWAFAFLVLYTFVLAMLKTGKIIAVSWLFIFHPLGLVVGVYILLWIIAILAMSYF